MQFQRPKSKSQIGLRSLLIGGWLLHAAIASGQETEPPTEGVHGTPALKKTQDEGKQQPGDPATKPAAKVEDKDGQDKTTENKDGKPEVKWTTLLPKEGLGEWQVTKFTGEGKVSRDGEKLVLEAGDPLTGVNLKNLGDFPKNNFEIELEATRIEGNDFLCGLTFPVGDEYCSFIAGGWGGGLVGLSSVNGLDAAENSTSSYQQFENGKWYKFRVRVDDEAVRAWVNDKELVYQEREQTEFSTRIEVFICQPLGYCVFQSTVELKNFRWRPITKEEKKD